MNIPTTNYDQILLAWNIMTAISEGKMVTSKPGNFKLEGRVYSIKDDILTRTMGAWIKHLEPTMLMQTGSRMVALITLLKHPPEALAWAFHNGSIHECILRATAYSELLPTTKGFPLATFVPDVEAEKRAFDLRASVGG